VARAKRTDRAEARRRYRAQLAAEDAGGEVDAEAAEVPAAASASRGRPAPRQPDRQAPPRSGMFYAFRAAFRPVNLREDLAQLPSLLRSRALLIPLLVTVVTAIVFRATSGREIVSVLLWQYFVFPPPIGAIFITGFFAQRASYLGGLIIGLVSALAFTLVVATAPAGFGSVGATPGTSPSPTASSPASAAASANPSPAASVGASPVASARASAAASAGASTAASAGASATPGPSASPAPTPVPPVDAASAAVQAFVISPIGGVVFASLAAWYRRFLKLANPNRAAGRPSANRGRPARRR
jgi:hypothetical protein